MDKKLYGFTTSFCSGIHMNVIKPSANTKQTDNNTQWECQAVICIIYAYFIAVFLANW